MAKKKIVMAGPDLASPGGMAAVIARYYSGGLVDQLNILYLPSYLSPGKLMQLKFMGGALASLLRLLMLRQVAVLHVNSASRGSFWRKTVLLMLAKLFGVPVVFHVHSGEFPAFYRGRGALVQAFIRWVMRTADEVVCLSQTWLNVLSHIEPAARISVIGNPIEVPDQLVRRSGPVRTVLFLGRLREIKGVFDLLDAVPRVLERHPDVRFVLAGDEGEKAVRDYAERLGVAHVVIVPGWVSGEQKQKLIDEADLFVLPSHFEALGVSILEAMAAGLPVVATRVGGIPDVINHGVNGLLVTEKQPALLADAINQLCDNETYRIQLAAAAYSMVSSTYALPRVFAQIEALYRRLGYARGREPMFSAEQVAAVAKD
jgi:glycosyltransferase involved in cell wall biosynthesis